MTSVYVEYVILIADMGRLRDVAMRCPHNTETLEWVDEKIDDYRDEQAEVLHSTLILGRN